MVEIQGMASKSAIKAGIIGCVESAGNYVAAGKSFGNFEVVACADADADCTQAFAAAQGIARTLEEEELVADPGVDLVINLASLPVRAQVTLAALAKGKHVYSEGPLARKRKETKEILEAAQASKLRVACGPDMFLGPALQACRSVIDSGAIGEPIWANVSFMYAGPETWHPEPEMLYKKAGGPLFDYGPAVLTALMSMLGPVREAFAIASGKSRERTIATGPFAGRKFTAEAPTTINASVHFESGANATLLFSYDFDPGAMPSFYIYGDKGHLSLPFEGCPQISRAGQMEMEDIACPDTASKPGIGVADLAAAIINGREPRASARMGFHVLDVLHSILDSAEKRTPIELTSTMTRPAPLNGRL